MDWKKQRLTINIFAGNTTKKKVVCSLMLKRNRLTERNRLTITNIFASNTTKKKAVCSLMHQRNREWLYLSASNITKQKKNPQKLLFIHSGWLPSSAPRAGPHDGLALCSQLVDDYAAHQNQQQSLCSKGFIPSMLDCEGWVRSHLVAANNRLQQLLEVEAGVLLQPFP